MSSTSPRPPAQRLAANVETPDRARFEQLFARAPSAAELELFRATRQALVMGLPARVRRAAGRVVTRL